MFITLPGVTFIGRTEGETTIEKFRDRDHGLSLNCSETTYLITNFQYVKLT